MGGQCSAGYIRVFQSMQDFKEAVNPHSASRKYLCSSYWHDPARPDYKGFCKYPLEELESFVAHAYITFPTQVLTIYETGYHYDEDHHYFLNSTACEDWKRS